MNSITRSLNIVAILTKNRDWKQMFLLFGLHMQEAILRIYGFIISFRSLFFVKIATMFQLLVILFIIKLYARNDTFKKICSYYLGRKVVFRKWILVVSVVSGLVVILFSVQNVRGGFTVVVLISLGRWVYYHVRRSLSVEHVLVIIV